MKKRSFPLLIFKIILPAILLYGCGGQATITPHMQVTIPLVATHDPPYTSLTPRPLPEYPRVTITGLEEMVYDWTFDKCANDMLPDLPVRVFRDASGLLQMNLSFTTNYRMIGPDLDSLTPDCNPTLVSNMDKDPSNFSYSEWMGSPYTLDGTTVYALIHNEFYGSDSSRWYALLDFSRTQGEADWYYESWNGVSYSNMHFDTSNSRWQGSLPLCQIGSNWVHPDPGCEPTRTWISTVDGDITISGSTYLYGSAGSDGVIVRILKNEVELWSVTINASDETEYPFDLEVPVAIGDKIRFRVNARGNSNYDSTHLNPEINLGPDPCPSGLRANCSQYAITFAVSTDGGQTYAQPPKPNHLVATLPYRYFPDWGFIGLWQPSNIVHNPSDGYYYVLIQHEYGTTLESDRLQGTCALRTQTLDDPSSWRAWDGTGFTMRMIDPYVETDTDPADHTCVVVSRANLGYAALNYNLTYNSFFEKFLLVGQSTNADISGFYFSLSDDLVNWSRMQLIMPADSLVTAGFEPPFLAYPAIVDPDDTSRNFEVSGQTPYLYFTRVNGMDPNLDFDLLRIRLEFSK
ncbi:hypothetical protein ACFLTX_02065 [Chloroflexota bacterium]